MPEPEKLTRRSMVLTTVMQNADNAAYAAAQALRAIRLLPETEHTKYLVKLSSALAVAAAKLKTRAEKEKRCET